VAGWFYPFKGEWLLSIRLVPGAGGNLMLDLLREKTVPKSLVWYFLNYKGKQKQTCLG